MKTFRRKQVEEITGIPWRRVAFYVAEGLVPLLDPHPGRGREHRFTESNLIQLSVIKELAAAGVELSRIRGVLAAGLAKYPEMFERETYRPGGPLYCIVVYKGRVFYGKTEHVPGKPEIFLTDMTDQRAAIVVNVSKIVGDIF